MKGRDKMIECVMVDTLPETANQILNILWDRNHAMNETEIREALEQEFSVKCEKQDVKDFIRFLSGQDYVEKKHKGLKTCYVALGADYVL